MKVVMILVVLACLVSTAILLNPEVQADLSGQATQKAPPAAPAGFKF